MMDYTSVIIARILVLILALALCAGIIFLQFFLSKHKSKWLGLILPLAAFLISLLVTMNIAVSYNLASGGVVQVTQYIDGQWFITTEYADLEHGLQRIPGAVASAVSLFLLFNIPTAIFLVIYKVVRSKQKRLRDIEKMSLQDLE